MRLNTISKETKIYKLIFTHAWNTDLSIYSSKRKYNKSNTKITKRNEWISDHSICIDKRTCTCSCWIGLKIRNLDFLKYENIFTIHVIIKHKEFSVVILYLSIYMLTTYSEWWVKPVDLEYPIWLDHLLQQLWILQMSLSHRYPCPSYRTDHLLSLQVISNHWVPKVGNMPVKKIQK